MKGNTQDRRSRKFHGEWRKSLRIELWALKEVLDGPGYQVVGRSGSCDLACVCGKIRKRWQWLATDPGRGENKTEQSGSEFRLMDRMEGTSAAIMRFGVNGKSLIWEVDCLTLK